MSRRVKGGVCHAVGVIVVAGPCAKPNGGGGGGGGGPPPPPPAPPPPHATRTVRRVGQRTAGEMRKGGSGRGGVTRAGDLARLQGRYRTTGERGDTLSSRNVRRASPSARLPLLAPPPRVAGSRRPVEPRTGRIRRRGCRPSGGAGPRLLGVRAGRRIARASRRSDGAWASPLESEPRQWTAAPAARAHLPPYPREDARRDRRLIPQ
jgi:hypothetical protein